MIYWRQFFVCTGQSEQTDELGLNKSFSNTPHILLPWVGAYICVCNSVNLRAHCVHCHQLNHPDGMKTGWRSFRKWQSIRVDGMYKGHIWEFISILMWRWREIVSLFCSRTGDRCFCTCSSHVRGKSHKSVLSNTWGGHVFIPGIW